VHPGWPSPPLSRPHVTGEVGQHYPGSASAISTGAAATPTTTLSPARPSSREIEGDTARAGCQKRTEGVTTIAVAPRARADTNAGLGPETTSVSHLAKLAHVGASSTVARPVITEDLLCSLSRSIAVAGAGSPTRRRQASNRTAPSKRRVNPIERQRDPQREPKAVSSAAATTDAPQHPAPRRRRLRPGNGQRLADPRRRTAGAGGSSPVARSSRSTAAASCEAASASSV
jgi:hypothetical protein